MYTQYIVKQGIALQNKLKKGKIPCAKEKAFISLCANAVSQDDMKYSKELLKGSTGLLILSILKKEDLYGYRIIRELEIASENAFEMTEGTLYPILHALEKEGALESYWREIDGRSRKYYHITKKGLRQLSEKQKEWESFSHSVTKVLNYA